MSFKLRRLRTTPARKPRTECCCQPVAFAIAAIVAPVGDCSIASTRDCFELRLDWLVSAGRAICCCGFFAVALDLMIDRLFVDFDIETLRSVHGALAPHHRSPTTAMKPAGPGLKRTFQRCRVVTKPLPSYLQTPT